jgi:hypothetical protein
MSNDFRLTYMTLLDYTFPTLLYALDSCCYAFSTPHLRSFNTPSFSNCLQIHIRSYDLFDVTSSSSTLNFVVDAIFYCVPRYPNAV